jgi:hypothetical protein
MGESVPSPVPLTRIHGMDPGNLGRRLWIAASTVVVRGSAWLGYACLNAIVPCIMGRDQMNYREDWSARYAFAGVLTVVAVMAGADLLIIGRLRKRRAIRRAINTIMLVLACTQLLPILQLLFGSIAVGIVGLDINGLKVFYDFKPIGADWNMETKIYVMTVITGLLLAIPFTTYAVLRTLFTPEAQPVAEASPPVTEPA